MPNLKVGRQLTVPLPGYPDLPLPASTVLTSQTPPTYSNRQRKTVKETVFDAGFVGTREVYTRNVTGIPQAPSANKVTKSWLTVKANATDLDNVAKYQLIITPTLSAAGQVTADGVTTGAGVATLIFTPTEANTNTLTPETQYYYDVQVLLNDGTERTVESGTLVMHQRTTIAVS